MDIGNLESMTDLRQMIIILAKSMKEDIQDEMRPLRQSIETERERNRKRIKEIDKKINKKCEKLEKKIEALTEKRGSDKSTESATTKESSSITKGMEDFMERKEREDKKNNIIIKGFKGNETREALRKKMEGCIRERIKVKEEVKYARKIGNGNMILAKIGTFEG